MNEQEYFNALENDQALMAWIAGSGFKYSDFTKRSFQFLDDKYLLLKTTEEQHNAMQAYVDATRTEPRVFSPIPGGNTVDVIKIGNAKIYFFPRVGEIQISLNTIAEQ